MKKFFLTACMAVGALSLTGTAKAAILKGLPDFSWQGAGGGGTLTCWGGSGYCGETVADRYVFFNTYNCFNCWGVYEGVTTTSGPTGGGDDEQMTFTLTEVYSDENP